MIVAAAGEGRFGDVIGARLRGEIARHRQFVLDAIELREYELPWLRPVGDAVRQP